MSDLVQSTLNGDRRALARILTVIENGREGADQALAALFPHTGRAWVIGVTGSPGTGKSSLDNALAKAFRKQEKTVGIVAVDPTSPFSGGAIMGDRIRMRDLAGDKGVFIRSMATRGSLGGLARATRDVIRVLDAAGVAIIFVETVGAGQSEVDIVRAAQTTVVVEAPGLGDDVQAIKAGILEIADVLAVNKADLPGADNTVRALKTMLEMGHPAAREQLTQHHGQLVRIEPSTNGSHLWIPPVVRTVAPEDQGIDDLITALEGHRQHLLDSRVLGKLDKQHIEIELYDRLEAALMAQLLKAVPGDIFTDVIRRIHARELDPQSAVEMILAQANQQA
ncbi:MAG: methylmalonyl Co-A mutase-associated GTPase MeaB [Anaerolineae bacterium]|nr:methylmalonyl Co-A mutase-associated GTPase MeaB [Anaerolineae bacterium]